MEFAYNIFLLFGGIALFLFGINFMSQSLYEALGDNLRDILEKLTSSPGKALILGIVVTALMQSSGAVMVMVTGFVAAQIMTLSRGIFVMLGAAIGTTITAQIIAFDIASWAPAILFVGLVLYQFVKNRKCKKIGAVVLGFGMLFMGIYLMGEAVDKMSLNVLMQTFLHKFNNPLLEALFGFVLTFVIQSSSASVGILQVLMTGSSSSDFQLASVVYMIIGMNIGAVAPVVIASLSGNRSGKRSALSAVMTKILGAIIFTIIMLIFPKSVGLIAKISADPARQIANFHLIFNIVGTVILIPFVSFIAKLIMKLVPDKAEDSLYSKSLLYIGKGQDKASSVMIAQSRQEIFRFSDLVKDNYHNAMQAFFTQDVDLAELVQEREETIDFLNKEIYQYLLNLSGKFLPENDYSIIGRMFNVLTDLERIGDHADNIAEYTIAAKRENATVSKTAWEELKLMGNKSVRIVDDAIEVFKNHNLQLFKSVQEQEDVIDDLKVQLENNHIDRMHHATCNPRGGILFIDIIVDYERVADHALNIAEVLFDAQTTDKIE